jgi:hypothetical protein
MAANWSANKTVKAILLNMGFPLNVDLAGALGSTAKSTTPGSRLQPACCVH